MRESVRGGWRLSEDRLPGCIVCDGAGPFAVVYRPPGAPSALVRCPDCGLVFRVPQPSEEELASSYYHDPEFTALLSGELRQFTIERAREKLALLEGAGVSLDGLRILDVGASSGAWLELARGAGAFVEGVEVGESTGVAAQARGLPVHVGTLADCRERLEQEPYELITFWDVLEHLRDPRVELGIARELLAAGGLLAATVPNVEGWYPRVTHRLLARRTGVWEYPEELHLYDFSPSTAETLVRRSGLEPRVLKTLPTPFRFYRTTSLAPARLGGGVRGLALRLAFESLHMVVYPLARLAGRENSLFVLAARAR